MNIRKPALTDLPALQSLWQEAFGDTTEFIQTFFDVAFDHERCFCVMDNDLITAALYWFDCEYLDKPVAYLYAIATAKAHQGQGICHKLMEHTHKYLLNAGYVGAVLVPGNVSLFDFYGRMGYETCCFSEELRCTAASMEFSQYIATEITQTPLSLRSIPRTEYALLRRQLLPKNGILQDKICLAFLETQAQLFSGEDFIMAAHIENDRLFVPELLGNTSHTQQILHTLNCKEGLFRTPGTQKPFAMYLSLSEYDLPRPTYFGLAFD